MVIIIFYVLDLVICNSFKLNVVEGILKLFELLFIVVDGWIGVIIIFGVFVLFWFVGIYGLLIVELVIVVIIYVNIEVNFKLF